LEAFVLSLHFKINYLFLGFCYLTGVWFIWIEKPFKGWCHHNFSGQWWRKLIQFLLEIIGDH